MIITIKRIDVLQAGKINACLWLGMAIIYLPFVMAGSSSRTSGKADVISVVIMLAALPVVGFLGGCFMAAVFNKASKVFGGLRVVCDQDNDRLEPATAPYSEPAARSPQG